MFFGMSSLFPCVHFSCAVIMNHIIHFISFSQCILHYFLVSVIMWMHLEVSGYMEPVKAKKFVVFVTWWRVEADANLMINNIPDTYSSMEF